MPQRDPSDLQPGQTKARVIGVWDDGDQRIVQISPGSAGGLAVGRKAVFPIVTPYGKNGADHPSTIIRVTRRFAVFKTEFSVDEIIADVIVS